MTRFLDSVLLIRFVLLIPLLALHLGCSVFPFHFLSPHSLLCFIFILFAYFFKNCEGAVLAAALGRGGEGIHPMPASDALNVSRPGT